ncbi:MAG: hypothetical protein JWR09_2428 [Mucilaginibacter sp.]|nr:hypothetical protein [Mucilaginibacter sp.]
MDYFSVRAKSLFSPSRFIEDPSMVYNNSYVWIMPDSSPAIASVFSLPNCKCPRVPFFTLEHPERYETFSLSAYFIFTHCKYLIIKRSVIECFLMSLCN